MSPFEEHKTKNLGELFYPDVIDQTLDQLDGDRITPQQEAILKFIRDNPDENYLELSKTFQMPDPQVINIVIEYGTPSEHYEEMKTLRDELLAKEI